MDIGARSRSNSRPLSDGFVSDVYSRSILSSTASCWLSAVGWYRLLMLGRDAFWFPLLQVIGGLGLKGAGISLLNWTILRPSGLFETPGVTNYRAAESFIGRYTSRADLVDCLLKQLTNAQSVHKVLMIATVSMRPNMLRLLLREALP